MTTETKIDGSVASFMCQAFEEMAQIERSLDAARKAMCCGNLTTMQYFLSDAKHHARKLINHLKWAEGCLEEQLDEDKNPNLKIIK
jgi:hypothetical protein